MKKILIVVVLVMTIVGTLAYIKLRSLHAKVYRGNEVTQPTRKEHNVITVLLMGYSGGTHEGTYLTDSMMVARVDIQANKVTLISLPRDMWVRIPTKDKERFYRKINAVYQLGLFPKDYPNVSFTSTNGQKGAALVKQIVGEVLGMDINYYVTVDFEGFTQAIDTLGGVTIDVRKAFDDYEYPITGKEDDLCGKTPEDLPELEQIATVSAVLAFPCRYEHIHFDKGEVTMDGETALKYVRSRHSLEDGGDFGRAARQQQFIEGVKNKVLQINFIPKILPLIDQLSDHVNTDIPLSDLQLLLNESSDVDQYSQKQVVLSTDNILESSYSPDGQYILISSEGIGNWKPVHRYVQDALATP